MAGSLPWKPPPPHPLPSLLGEWIEAEPSPLGEKAPFWTVWSCPAEKGWWRGAPLGQRQCQRSWASLVWSCSGCSCQRLQGVSKVAQSYSVGAKGRQPKSTWDGVFIASLPVLLHILGFTFHGGRRKERLQVGLSSLSHSHLPPTSSGIQSPDLKS